MINRRNKRVLFLGAGASFASDFKLPVMTGFFGPERDEFIDLFQFLESFYPNYGRSEYNLEDVLTFLTISRNRMWVWGLPPSVGSLVSYGGLYSTVLRYIHHRLEIPKDGICSLHKNLFSTLDPKDSILTLNYDLVADQVLSHLAPKKHDRPDENSRIGKLDGLLSEQSLYGALQPPSLMPREEEQGFYLKLHGSLDWLRCPTPGCRNHVNIFCCGTSKLADGQTPGRPCRFCGTALETMIVPPITAKPLEDRGRIALLWNLALRELRCVENIAFIGVSLAPTDFELRWLIREGLAFESESHIHVQIVNPDPTHCKAITSLLASNLCDVKEYSDLKEYLATYGQ